MHSNVPFSRMQFRVDIADVRFDEASDVALSSLYVCVGPCVLLGLASSIPPSHIRFCVRSTLSPHILMRSESAAFPNQTSEFRCWNCPPCILSFGSTVIQLWAVASTSPVSPTSIRCAWESPVSHVSLEEQFDRLASET